MRITNLEKFKQVCSKQSKVSLRSLLGHMAFCRILSEFTLVDILKAIWKNGDSIPKTETLKDYASLLEGERVIIGFLGRRDAAKVYGRMEGITSDVKTVDWILENDSSHYYRELIHGQEIEEAAQS